MRAVLLCLGAIGVDGLIPSAGYTFDDFISDFGRDYKSGTEAYNTRKQIFEAHLSALNGHNADEQQKWTMGVNDFSDLTQHEFKNSGKFGYNKALARELAATASVLHAATPVQLKDLPSSVDWRKEGVVTDVKDQGNCGSCWAFASTEQIESHVAIATGTLEVFSPQQLLSCASNPLQCGGTGGCGGSVPEVAYNYAQLTGMITEWMMPYTSYYGKTGDCELNLTHTPAVATISGYVKLPPNNYAEVMNALATVGPLAINIDAGSWHSYQSGVFDGCSKGKVDIDHVVQLVGYGTDAKGGDYWSVRNSWDTVWGENGYIRLERHSESECGKDTTPLDGTGCKGGPAEQTVCGACGILFDVSYPTGGRIVKYGHHVIYT